MGIFIRNNRTTRATSGARPRARTARPASPGRGSTSPYQARNTPTGVSTRTVAIATVAALVVAVMLGLSYFLSSVNGEPGVQAQIVYQAPTANDAAITLPDTLLTTLQNIGQHNGAISLTRIDGATTTTRRIDLTPRAGSSTNAPELKVPGRRTAAITTTITTLQHTINTAQASTGTRALYAGLLKTTFAPNTPIYLIGSELDLANPTDARKLGFDTNPATVVKTVTATGDVPALAGNDVTFIPVGTAGRQGQIRTNQQKYLNNLWTALLSNGHAKTVTFTDPINGPSQSTTPAPTVTIPPLPGTPITPTVTPPTPGHPKKSVCTLAASTYFIPDTPTLIDPAATRRALTGCVHAAGTTTTITLDAWVAYFGPLTPAGKPASNPKEGVTLSNNRNTTIANLLVTMGINPARITGMTGHGTNNQPYPTNPSSPKNRACQITFHQQT